MSEEPLLGVALLPWEMTTADWVKALNTVQTENLGAIWAALTSMIGIRMGVDEADVIRVYWTERRRTISEVEERQELIRSGVHLDSRFEPI